MELQTIILFAVCITASIATLFTNILLFAPYDLSTELTDNANNITENEL